MEVRRSIDSQYDPRTPLLPINDTLDVQVHERKGTWYSTFINLFLAAAGTGILSLPYTYANTGVTTGTIMLIVMALISAYSMDLLIRCAVITGSSNYEHLAKKCFGRPGELFVKINLLIFLFGAAVLFMIVFTGLLTPFLRATIKDDHVEHILTDPYLLTGIGLILVFPLTLLNSLNSLRFTSTGGVVCLLYVLVIMVYRFAQSHNISPTVEPIILQTDIWKLCLALPIQGIAFCAQFSVLPLFHELQKPSLGKMNSVIYTFSFACFLLYAVVGIFGYFLFGSALTLPIYQGNVLTSFPDGDVLISIARCLLAGTILLKVPLCSLPFRETLNDLIWPGKKKIAFGIIFFQSVIYLLVAGVLAVVVKDLNTALGIMGGTSGVCISFVFPGALYLKAVPNLAVWRKVTAVGMIIFGIAVGVLSITIQFV